MTEPHRSPLVALLAANAVSQAGDALTYLAIPWFVLQITGSPARAGITVAAGAVPAVIAGAFGGAIVDRVGARRASIVSDIASGAAVMSLPLLYHTTGLAFWQLLLLVFVRAVVYMPGGIARRSLLPELAQAGGVSLERANTAYQVVYRSANLIGPPLAGVLVVTIGTSNLLWIDAGTFAVSALVVAAGVPGRRPAHERRAEERGRYLAEVAEGFRFIGRDRLVLTIIGSFVLGGLLAEPFYPVILPVFAREVYGSAVDLGILYAALAAGSLGGNALFLAVGRRLPRRAMFVGGFAGRALTFWVLVPMPPLGVLAAATAVNAVCFEPINPLSMTILQERIPAGARGRVFGAMTALIMGMLPLGMVAYGALIEAAGLRPTLVVLATVNLAAPVLMLLVPGFRTAPTVAPAGAATTGMDTGGG